MINNDSVVTAYDEHLTLVEWLQKVEVLLKNGGLKETILNDKGNATFSLTLTFNDGTKLESNVMTLESVNTALASVNTALRNLTLDLDTATHRIDDLEDEVDYLKKYKGFENITYDKTNCVRIGGAFDAIECKLKRSDNFITLSENDFNVAHELLLKAVSYGFVVEVFSENSHMLIPLINVTFNGDDIDATFGVAPNDAIGGIAFRISLNSAIKNYKCYRLEF
jgi:hypothetical protein